MNQSYKVLNLLDTMRERGLTGNEAEDLLRCRDLPKRISELRQLGNHIVRELRSDVRGQRYARYWLLEHAPMRLQAA